MVSVDGSMTDQPVLLRVVSGCDGYFTSSNLCFERAFGQMQNLSSSFRFGFWSEELVFKDSKKPELRYNYHVLLQLDW